VNQRFAKRPELSRRCFRRGNNWGIDEKPPPSDRVILFPISLEFRGEIN
jgi:hypothetical protein